MVWLGTNVRQIMDFNAEYIIPWGSLSMRPYLSINDLIYESFNNFLGQWNIYELAFRPDVHSSFYRTFPEL